MERKLIASTYFTYRLLVCLNKSVQILFGVVKLCEWLILLFLKLSFVSHHMPLLIDCYQLANTYSSEKQPLVAVITPTDDTKWWEFNCQTKNNNTGWKHWQPSSTNIRSISLRRCSMLTFSPKSQKTNWNHLTVSVKLPQTVSLLWH